MTGSGKTEAGMDPFKGAIGAGRKGGSTGARSGTTGVRV